jgi:TfoX/Sxy family transcriptional regulator of competence genes
MSHDPKALQQLLTAAAPPDLALAFKPMFGGILAYLDGKAFASLSDMGLALKAGPALMAALLAEPGARPLRYRPDDPPSKSYVLAPEAMLTDRDALRGWIARAAADLAKTGTRGATKKARAAPGPFAAKPGQS